MGRPRTYKLPCKHQACSARKGAVPKSRCYPVAHLTVVFTGAGCDAALTRLSSTSGSHRGTSYGLDKTNDIRPRTAAFFSVKEGAAWDPAGRALDIK